MYWCWPNLRVHAPQNSSYHLLTSLKPLSLARPNCNAGAAWDQLQLANKLEHQCTSINRVFKHDDGKNLEVEILTVGNLDVDVLNVAPAFCVSVFFRRNLRTRRGIHLRMQDDQNGQKIMVFPSAEKTRLTRFKYFSSKRPSLAADGNTIMNLPCLIRLFVNFYSDIFFLLPVTK
jgi:hypothetical protein